MAKRKAKSLGLVITRDLVSVPPDQRPGWFAGTPACLRRHLQHVIDEHLQESEARAFTDKNSVSLAHALAESIFDVALNAEDKELKLAAAMFVYISTWDARLIQSMRSVQ